MWSPQRLFFDGAWDEKGSDTSERKIICREDSICHEEFVAQPHVSRIISFPTIKYPSNHGLYSSISASCDRWATAAASPTCGHTCASPPHLPSSRYAVSIHAPLLPPAQNGHAIPPRPTNQHSHGHHAS